MSTSAAQQKSNENGEYSILDSIIAETRLTPDDEAYDIAKRGVGLHRRAAQAAEQR